MNLKPRKPNVIIILVDDAGYGDLGCHSNPWLNTPNIDNLYNSSVRLTDFHTDPMCAPTRAALLTGKYAANVGVWSTLNGRYILNKDHKTMADYFKDSGYKTGIFGKWHLGDNYPYRPADRGFDRVVTFEGGVVGETPDYWDNDYFDDKYIKDGELKSYEGYCTDVWFDEAKKFIREANNSTSFFCYIATNAPHTPLNVDIRYAKPYIDKGVPEDRAKFFGMIQNIDENFGKLENMLKELNILDDTIIIYMGDNGTANGANLDRKGFLKDGYNAGFRGKKCSPYEGGHRNACFVRWKNGNIFGGRDLNGLSLHLDLLPTLIELCGLKEDGSGNFDGKSIAYELRNDIDCISDRTMIVHNMQLETPKKYKDFCVMTNKYRLVRTQTWEQSEAELYDISKDPGQLHDLSKVYPDIVKSMLKEYDKWWEMISKQFSFYNRIIIGSDKEKITKLTCHAWHGSAEMSYNQIHIRKGIDDQGFWSLDVCEEGLYRIELRRWPREVDKPISGTVPGIINKQFVHDRPEGKAYNIHKARISIQGKDISKTVKEEDTYVLFEVELKKGEADLNTWFYYDDKYIGAYYAYIEKLSKFLYALV